MRVLLLVALALALGATDAPPAVFTDEMASLPCALPDGVRACRVRVIDRAGISAPGAVDATVAGGLLALKPLREGIHIVDAGDGVELRFLAAEPPVALDPAVLRAALPRRGGRLLAGEPFSILAMGDSVTATGEHHRLLALMLARATGNQRIAVVQAAYPGRSVDAAVREFARDAACKPDLGLLMYGLNDQICWVPVDGYLEQAAWVAAHLRDEHGADSLFLQPTQHLDTAEAVGEDFFFRAVGFAAALEDFGATLGVPVARSFDAVWGAGGPDLATARARMLPLYPLGYDKPFTTLLESADGVGDTIHPNALGHLAIARAAYSRLALPPPPPEALTLSAVSRWADDGMRTTITARNDGASRRVGELRPRPPYGARIAAPPIAYDLAPGESILSEVAWPDLRDPAGALRHPYNHSVSSGAPALPVLDVVDDGMRVRVVAAPFAVPAVVRRERVVSADGAYEALVRCGDARQRVALRIPDGADVARLPVVRRVERDGAVGWATAEVVFTRFASAADGETVIDGALDEWTDAVWSPLGEPSQARWTDGPADHRATPDECRPSFALRAGASGFALAVRTHGEHARDGFTLFLDRRAADLLGSAGPYWWCNGRLEADGAVRLDRGETTRGEPAFAGRWTRDGDGDDWRIEALIPYAAMDADAWPAGGDLGLSLVWDHAGPGGTTHLMWAEDGHPWNTRWYGVARRQAKPDRAALPFRVRVR